MAQPRVPASGQWANVSPPGAADSTPPGTPKPGPLGSPSPIDPLVFTPSPSPLQAASDAAAVSTVPGPAGPVCVNPTQNNQDFGARPFQGDQDPGSAT
jgi:hypothetical protein